MWLFNLQSWTKQSHQKKHPKSSLSAIKPSTKIYTCISTSKPWLRHFLNKTLNLSQVSHKGSLVPCTNVTIVTFVAMFLDGGKKRAKKFVSTSFQLINLWLGCDCNHALSFQSTKWKQTHKNFLFILSNNPYWTKQLIKLYRWVCRPSLFAQKIGVLIIIVDGHPKVKRLIKD